MRKAYYGTVEGVSYAFRVDGVDGGEFFGLPSHGEASRVDCET